jgi:hypothetical protein
MPERDHRADLSADDLADYRERLHKAHDGLMEKRDNCSLHAPGKWAEYDGKARGVALALDYLRSYK